ncbi:N-acetylglucosamine/diacetylchitobiose ABC transporter substrate-binding protein [Actinokineospora sp. NPDC004072]
MTFNRRRMLHGLGGLAVLTAVPACAFGGNETDTPTGPTGDGGAENPFGVKADTALEVVIFKGGLGDKYATEVHEPMYAQKYPGAKVEHVATQQIAQTLQPRFAGGDVPDVIANSGTDLMDLGALVDANQLLDLTPLFDAPAIDDPNVKVRDRVVNGSIEAGFVGGKPHALMYVYTAYGLWYDAKLFEANGWEPAKTWADFDALCAKIKAKGLHPFAYPGKNAAYYQYWSILISAAKIAGNKVLIDVDNLVDGIWTSDPIRQSAAAWAEIGAKYLDKSYEGLTHTEVQTAQNQGRIGFFPCGSWLENEQKDQTPAGFEYAMCPLPSVTGNDAMPYESIRTAAGEGYIVPAQAKNSAGGLEYLRIMLSHEGARGFTEKTGSITIVKGAADGLPLSPGNKSVAAAQSAAGDNIVTYNSFENWYKELETELRAKTNALMFGRITADQFCTDMQAKADSVKADSSIPKQQRNG